jgi:hypothetical protein
MEYIMAKDANTFSAVQEGNTLVIRIPLESPTPSASGKTLVVASTRGNILTSIMVNNKPVKIGINAYVTP